MERLVIERVRNDLAGFEGEVKIEPVFSGTNKIFKVRSEERKVLYREFGNNFFVDPENERKNFRLVSEAGLGPEALVETPTYRIESFIEGETMRRDQIEMFAESIVPDLYRFHCLDSGYGLPMTEAFIDSWTSFLKVSSKSYQSSLSSAEKFKFFNMLTSINELASEAKNLIPKCEKLVFCHNDFSYGNVIHNSQKFHIIDYEYAGLSNPSVDLATFVVESMFDFSTPEFRFVPEDEISIEKQHEMVGIYADIAGMDSDDFWNEFLKSKAVVNYLGSIWASCMFKPGQDSMLRYAENRLGLFHKYSQAI